ncbi:ribosomal protein S9/S16-domain-containing protein [Mycena albidolilacea]|uniref:Ribosomal protein S9/S16-domain-containing protein n=1 Tax=Mycena albidolilacea TaxID=1033008 RepID=A0AAD7ES98_9AGAR|nr:ribosomal protein S9/S16-domain-containing protein [Mycena albidolilacea]
MQGLLRAGLAPLRRHVLHPPRRAFAARTPFVPPSQQMQSDGPKLWPVEEDLNYEEEEDSEEEVDEEGTPVPQRKPPPASPSFYSGRAAYYDQLAQVESAVVHTRSALKMLQLLPLPDFAREALPTRPAVWKNAKEMGLDLQVTMTSSRYRAMTRLLGQLNEYHRIASAAGCEDLALRTSNLLNIFESPAKTAALTRGRRKTLYTDHLGRSYTFGKRKTSTARVWMVPVALPSEEMEVVDLEKIASLDEAAALLTSQPDRFHEPQRVPTSSILINNIPIGEYFAAPADRERVIRPIKVAGLLGAYNVFSLVRGGGSTGQSGALAHGISKGLLVHNPDLADLFRRTKLLRRDPRMVERKKPGLAKARKAYAWVKR